MTEPTTCIDRALAEVNATIRTCEARYSRAPGSVQLLAVSKKKPVSDIRDAIAAGQYAFGENYVDEAVEKIVEIDHPAIEWHFIGAIQSRKTSTIAEHFHWAHSVDRAKVATRLANQRPTHLPPLNICLQVNLDNEPGKAGISLDHVVELAQHCSTLEGLTMRGLMAIPAPRNDFESQREVFARLRQCLAQLQRNYPGMDTLSMGMSADMEAAIAEGATIVRVGTAIFGARDS